MQEILVWSLGLIAFVWLSYKTTSPFLVKKKTGCGSCGCATSPNGPINN